MKIVLITVDNEEITLKNIISAVLTQTAEAACDSLSIKFIDNIKAVEIEKVLAYKDDELIFNGYCDCQKSTVDEKGFQTYIYARSSACLLVDNDAFAYTYNCPSALSLFQAYAKDLGFKFKLPNVYTLKKYEVTSGASLFGAINSLVSMISGNGIRINASNEIIMLEASKDILNLNSYPILSVKSIINRSEPISAVHYKKEFSSNYDCHTYSKSAKDLGFSRNRYVNLISLASWQRNYKISKMIKDSFKNYKCLEITISGYCSSELYQRFNYESLIGKFDDYLLLEKIYSYDKNGEKCKLVLGKNIDVKEVNYVD